jgi:phage FluMu gp28-like protein
MIKTVVNKYDLKKYDDKFKEFDEVNFAFKQQMMREDPTLFAYALFRDNKGDRMKLYPFQDLIINDTKKMIAVAVSRQCGKTTTADIKALHAIFYNDNYTVLVISKTKDQSMEIIQKLRAIINTCPIKAQFEELASGADNRREFYLKNYGKETYSRIISVPATDAARGYSADLVIADEIAFWENSIEIFNEAILPTVSHTNGTIMMLSTPKGASGVFYDAFTKDNIWSCYQFDWTVCPAHTQDSMNVKKEQIGEFAFRQEYEASFLANQAAYFLEKEVRDATDESLSMGVPTSMPTVIGVDFGKRMDNTVICIGVIENPMDNPDYHRIKVIDLIVKPLGTDYNKIVGELRALFTKYKPVNILYDQTGVGEGPGDFMKDIGLKVEGVKFSIQSKVDMFSNLKILFEKRQIKIPKNKRLIDELLLFEYEYTTSGNMKLHHPEGGHDDHVDALCLMAFGLKRPTRVPVSMKFIEYENDSRNDGKSSIDDYYSRAIIKDREQYYKSKEMFGRM